MSTRINLNDEGTQFIELKDISELRSGDKRAAKAGVSVRIDPQTGEQIVPGDYDMRMKNALAVRVITNWTLDLPLPRFESSSLDKLTFEQESKLYEALEPYVDAINESEKTDPTKPDTDPTIA